MVNGPVFVQTGLLTFSEIEYDELCASSITIRFLGQSVRDSEGQFILILEEEDFRPHLFFAVAAYFDRHAFRARAKEVYHVDTMRLSERARSEG